jgi:microcystin-dependent protein
MTKILNPQIYATSIADFLVGGKIYAYIADTSTLKATYQTVEDAQGQINPNTNPIILDSKGRARIVTNGPTKLVLKDRDDNIIWTVNDLDTSSLNLLDSNGNEVLVFNAVANAINSMEIRNAVTGSAPRLSAIGTDTNIDLHLKPKGSSNTTIAVGGLKLDQGSLTIAAGSATLTSGDVNLSTGNLVVDTLDTIPIASVPLLSAGSIAWFAGSAAPTGWLECNGGAVSRTTYAGLFGKISTVYGVGDGSTTFNLPTQARNVLVGKGGSGTGTLGNATGNSGGAETHTLTSAEMASHTHTYYVGDLDNTVNVASGGSPQSVRNIASPANTQTSSSAGSGNSHNIVQPSLVMMMIIKT